MATGNECACCKPPWSFQFQRILEPITTRGLNSLGQEQWNHDHGITLAVLRCCYIDSSENVYVGGDPGTGGHTVRKHDSSGIVLWSAIVGSRPRGIEVDSSGNVYVGGDRSGEKTIWKFNSSGVLQWSEDAGNNVFGLALDASGNPYTSGSDVRKYDSDGNLLLTISPAGVNDISIAANGDIYSIQSQILWKHDSNGTLQWSEGVPPISGSVDALASSAGCVIGVAVGGQIKKFDSSGVEITTGSWPLNHGAGVNGLGLDSSDNVYTAGNAVSGVTNRKYNSDGVEQWTFNHDTGGTSKSSTDIAATAAGVPALVGQRVVPP